MVVKTVRGVDSPGPIAKLDESGLREFVQRHADAPDPRVQDQVGRARLKLGYAAAHRKDFTGARAEFLTASREYRGTNAMSADFGGLPDQAAYQAAVCLAADGKKEEAEREFRRFLKDRALSPLVGAAYRRIERLKGGPDEDAQALLQSALDKQQARVRFETSVCGPKAIAHMLPMVGKPAADYKEIAKLCGTTDRGTTLEGMRAGLKKLGVETYGLQVNRDDFLRLPIPFLVLEDDHYVLVTEAKPREAIVFDPRFGSDRRMPLPASDSAFTATVLTTRIPEDLSR
jgi:hypothetical protein